MLEKADRHLCADNHRLGPLHRQSALQSNLGFGPLFQTTQVYALLCYVLYIQARWVRLLRSRPILALEIYHGDAQ